MALKKAVWNEMSYLGSFASDSSSQLDVLWHNGDPLGVDGAQVCVLKETNQVSFRCLLKGSHGCALEPQVSLEILSNLPHEPLERQLSDEQFSGLLVTTDFSQGNSTRPVTMRLLDSSSGRSALPCCLGGELLSWGLASS